MKMYSTHNLVRLSGRAARIGALLCVCAAPSVLAKESVFDSGFSFWGVTGDHSHFSAAQGPSLLRPPASWSWDTAAPVLDMAAGVTHHFDNGLNLGLGMSLSHATDALNAETINYRDYFLGLSFGAVEGKVWYLPETAFTDEPSLYYEAGWLQPVTEKLSLSLRLGQYSSDYSSIQGYSDQPSLSLGASTQMRGYGLGLRLIDGGGHMFGGEEDLRVMGSISKPLR